MWLGRLLLIALTVGAAAGCVRQPFYGARPPLLGAGPGPVGAPIAAAPLPPPVAVAVAPGPIGPSPLPPRAGIPLPPPRPTGGLLQIAQYGPPPPPAPAPVMLADEPYTLGPGDRLRVVVFGQEGLTNTFLVDAGGNISMPLIGVVPALGATTAQLSAVIASRLQDGFIREPHVAVEIETYRPFFILGEVTFPGQYPYVANMTVETAVAIAGGFTPRAKKASVDLTRRNGGPPIRTAVPLYAPVRPGDTIMVAERWF